MKNSKKLWSVRKMNGNPEEITFINSVGASYLDFAVAKGDYPKAKKLGVGIEVEV